MLRVNTLTDLRNMIKTDLKVKSTLRGFLNENRITLESEVDDLINDLWKLKRKIRNAYKDSHYDVYNYIDELKHVGIKSYDLRSSWDQRVRDHLKKEESIDSDMISTLTLDKF